MAEQTGGKSKSAMVTIATAVIGLFAAGGLGSWQLQASGDEGTQAIVREELRSYGDKMEAKVKAERDLIRLEMKRDRDDVHAKIEGIEKSTQQTAIDIAVIKSRLELAQTTTRAPHAFSSRRRSLLGQRWTLATSAFASCSNCCC
jgi:predicted phage gp36 major capsid-like protein